MEEWDLLRPIAVLFSIAFVASLIKDRYLRRWPDWDCVFIGVKYALVALAGMLSPLIVLEGVRYDARVPFVALAAMFGGAWGGAIATLPPLLFRIHLGGIGTLTGVISIMTGALVGYGLRYVSKRKRRPLDMWTVCGLGAVVTALTLLWTVLLPAHVRHLVLFEKGWIISSVYFAVTFIFGALELQDVRRREKDLAIAQSQMVLTQAQRIGRFGMAALDLDSYELHLSKELARMYGIESVLESEPVLDFVSKRIDPHDMPKVDAAFKTLNEGKLPEPFKFHALTPGGKRLFMAFYLGFEEDTERRVVIALVQDVTDTNALFDQMSHTARLATLGEMAASLGHEISNPLAVARMNAERLELKLHSGLGNEQASLDLISKLIQRLDAIGSLIRGVTLFARSDTEELRPTSLHRSIKESADFFRDLGANEATEIVMDLDPNEYLVMGSPVRVQQILFNLLNNARHATEGIPNARVSVSTRYIDGVVELVVEDNGRGISPDIKSKIFTPFFTTKERGKGTGLGLSITAALIKDLHGSIDVESEPGRGTKFVIHFPLLKPNASRSI